MQAAGASSRHAGASAAAGPDRIASNYRGSPPASDIRAAGDESQCVAMRAQPARQERLASCRTLEVFGLPLRRESALQDLSNKSALGDTLQPWFRSAV